MRTAPLVCLGLSALVSACGPEDVFAVELGFEAFSEAEIAKGFREAEHDLEVSVAFGEVRLLVTRTFHNVGTEPSELELEFPMLAGGVAGELAIEVDGVWRPAVLLERADADEVYDESDGEHALPGPPSVILEWLGDAALRLRARPVSPHVPLRVRYAVRAPLRYHAGDWLFDLPLPPETSPQPRIVLGAGVPRVLRSWVLGEDAAAEEEAPTSGRTLRYHLERPRFDDVSLRWGTFPLAPGRSALRLEVEAPKEWMPVPRGATFVFAVDASRSIGEDGVRDQLALIPHVLAHAPDARVEVVLFRRRAERLFGRLVPARNFEDELARIPEPRFALGNGSNLDEAIVEVRRVLRESHGPARAILFTDERLPSHFDPAQAAIALTSLPRDTFAHVVSRNPYDPLLLESLGDHWLRVIPEESGGGMFRLSGGVTTADEALQLEELVRPLWLEQITLLAGELEDDLPELEPLEAGASFVHLSVVEAAPPPRLSLRGQLWTRPIEVTTGRDAILSDQVPARLLGADEVLLTEEETILAADHARVVSSETSLVVSAEGRAPYTGFGAYRLGSRMGGATRCRGGSGGRGMSGMAPRSPIPFLERAARGCANQLGLDDHFVEGSIEVTVNEIVAVEIADASNTELANCTREAIWGSWLHAGTPDGTHAFVHRDETAHHR